MRVMAAGAYLTLAVLLACFVAFGQPARGLKGPPAPSRFRIDRAVEDLRAIDALSTREGGRSAASRGNALVRGYVANRFEEAGLRVVEQPFLDTLGGPMVNVLASLPGGRDETILVCAHHDLEGSTPGAVDGTAGLAVLLELARASSEARLAEGNGPQGRTILFASWDGESFACAGSTHFVEILSPKDRGRLRAVVSLDSVGWRGGGAVLHALPYADRFGVVARAPDWLVMRLTGAAEAGGTHLPFGDRWLGLVYQVMVRAVDLGYYSDDRPFLARGVPAVFIGNLSLTSSYSRSGTSSDTIDQVDPARITSVGRTVEGAIANLAADAMLPPGEKDYLVFFPRILGGFRLTSDQAKTIGIVALLPGAIVLLRRRKDGGLLVTRALFFAFAVLYASALYIDPILVMPLFVPALLAGPLLAIPRASAAWAHVVSLVPALVFGVLLASVYVTGSSYLVRVSSTEILASAGLTAIALAQIPLHLRRARPTLDARPD